MADYNINAVTRRQVFSGSAGTGPYAFTFEVLDQNDVAVYKNATKLTLTTNYTVAVNANGTGSVTLGVGASASDKITIIGARDIERTTDFVTAGDLRASALNEQLDGQIIMVQQLAEENKRQIAAPVEDPEHVDDGGTLDMTLPAKDDRKGKYLAFNETTGNPEVGASAADVTTVADVAADITTVAGETTNMQNITDNLSAIQNAATNAATATTKAGEAATSATAAQAAQTAAENAADYYTKSEVDSVATITDLLQITLKTDERVVHVSDPIRGGTFIYDSARSSDNDGGLVFDGWVRQYHGFINSKWYSNYGASETALDGVEKVDGGLWQSLCETEGQGAVWKYGINTQRGYNDNPYDASTEPSGYANNDVSYAFLHDFKPKYPNGNRTDGANVFLGGRAGNFSAAPDSGAVGNYNIHCGYNTGIGHQALNNITTAYNSTATGVNAGRYLTQGYGNTFNGRDSGHETTVGYYNCALGQSSLFSNVSGYENIAIGVTSLRDVGGNQNIGIGVDSLFNTATGDKNIGIGYQAGYGVTSGSNNTFIGQTPIANYPNGAQSGLLVISAGAVPRIQGDSDGKLSLSGDVPTATLEYRRVDTTAYDGTAAGGQVASGATMLVANDGTANNVISQIVLQPRISKPVCRIVATDGLTSTLRFVTNDTEKLFITSAGAVRPTGDNSQQLGGASNRWSVVFAGTGTINTSDDREKTYFDITDTEKAVALELKRNMKKFKYNDRVAAKGDGARIHFGASAQTVKSIFESHGLVAEDYAILCHDTWEEDGVTKDVYGLRYDELLSFIIGAM